MGFGLGFQKGFGRGVPLGVQSFLVGKKIKADTEGDLEKQRQLKIKKDSQTTMAGELFGVETKRDEVTGELKLDIPEDFQLGEVTEAQRLEFLPQVGGEFQKIFRELDKETQPKDFFINKKSEMDIQTKQGIVTGIDTNPESETFGDRIKIGDDPNYKPKKTDETIFEGIIDIEGRKIGQKGKRTKIMTYEDGSFTIQDVGDIKGKDGSSKPIETVMFETNLAEIGVKKAQALEKYSDYIKKGVGKKGFGNEQARDLKRQRINADLNKVAWDYLELGSDKAQQYGHDILTESKILVNTQIGSVNNVDRRMFYDQKLLEVLDDAEREEWSHQDLTAVLQFIQAKYKNYIKSQEPAVDEDELKFDLPELQR